MGGIIDFNTTCPWELYLFAFVHLAAAIFMYLFDSCRLIASSSSACTDTELVMESFVVLSLFYVGVIFTVLTYHSKNSAAKITRLSNIALNGATALLVSVIFAGNESFGGIERSWMHMADMLTMIVLVGVLSARVAKSDAEWAQKNPLDEGMGVNCKTLLLLFLVLTAIKIVAFTDFIDPMKLLAERSSEMTDFAMWMWKFTAVLILEVFLAILYAVLFDDDAGHELVVFTIVILSVVATGSLYSVQKYMSNWMGLNSNTLWVGVGILVLVCIAAIVGGRRGSSHSGYQNVGS